MALNLYYVISKGSRPVGENGFTVDPANVKKFTSVQEAYDWLSEQTDAPATLYTITTFIEKTAE